jgi:hypothetical protein
MFQGHDCKLFSNATSFTFLDAASFLRDSLPVYITHKASHSVPMLQINMLSEGVGTRVLMGYQQMEISDLEVQKPRKHL